MRAADGGFVLAELLAAAALLAAVSGWLLHSGGSLHETLCRMQVRTASAALAAELRALQREAMFKENGTALKLRIDSSRTGYIVYRGLEPVKKLNMEKIGCEGVYFTGKITAAGFSAGGSPLNSGSYELRHRLLDYFSCTVTVQPVTGRVIINEKKQRSYFTAQHRDFSSVRPAYCGICRRGGAQPPCTPEQPGPAEGAAALRGVSFTPCAAPIRRSV